VKQWAGGGLGLIRRDIEAGDYDVIAETEVAPERADAAGLFERVYWAKEHHHHVDVRVRKRIAPSLGTEQNQTGQAGTVDGLQAVLELLKDVVQCGCHGWPTLISVPQGTAGDYWPRMDTDEQDEHGPRMNWMNRDKNKELVLDVMFIGVYPRLPGWFRAWPRMDAGFVGN
jgi:hypothetical protein